MCGALMWRSMKEELALALCHSFDEKLKYDTIHNVCDMIHSGKFHIILA